MTIDNRSKYLRSLIIRMIKVGRRGHIGSAMSLVEILRALYDNFLTFNPLKPFWENRDRLILSKGHGCLALFAILADKNFFPIENLDTFCEPKSILGGHPEFGKVPGIEASTGSLGHGLPIGVGMAIAAKLNNKNHKIIVITGDGELNEGSNWEALMSASKHKLNNLCLIVDYNKIQSYGSTFEVLDLEPLSKKLISFGFQVMEVDGHNIKKINICLNTFKNNLAIPTAIICHTIKGKGISFAENNPNWHHKSNITDTEFDDINNALSIKEHL
jgi:transketolase